MIDQLLEYLAEDKHTNASTTSNKFKRDLWNFFNRPEYSTTNSCEFGTHKGQTAYILSHLFNTVYTINLSETHFEDARKINVGRSNIEYIPFDLYREKLEYNPIQDEIGTFFIDAGHGYHEVIKDVTRCMQMTTVDHPHIIFDDYGLNLDVHNAVNDMIEDGWLEIIQEIGHEKNYEFDNGRKLLYGPEGIICILKEKELI